MRNRPINTDYLISEASEMFKTLVFTLRHGAEIPLLAPAVGPYTLD